MTARTLASFASLIAAASLVYAGWEPSLFLFAFGLAMLSIGFLAFTIVAVQDLTNAFSELSASTAASERSRA